MTNETSKFTPAGTPTSAFYANLRQLKADCGRNKHHQALMLIVACVEEGINTTNWIVAALEPLGLKPPHLRMILNGKIQADEARNLWRRDIDGCFVALPPPSVPAFKRPT